MADVTPKKGKTGNIVVDLPRPSASGRNDFCYISRQVDVADTPNMEFSHRPVIQDSVSQRHVTDDGSVNDPVRPGS